MFEDKQMRTFTLSQDFCVIIKALQKAEPEHGLDKSEYELLFVHRDICKGGSSPEFGFAD